MIQGLVRAGRHPCIPLRVLGVGGVEVTVTAVVDTGFTGELTLPPAVIAHLGLPRMGDRPSFLAGGLSARYDVHAAVVEWHGALRGVYIDAVDDDPLVGMGLLADSTLFIDCQPGGTVEVRPRP